MRKDGYVPHALVPGIFDIRRLLVREELPDRIDRKYKMDKEIRVR